MPRIDKTFSLHILPWIIPGLIALFVLFIISTFFVKLIHVPSHDMHPTYNRGDLVMMRVTNHFEQGDLLAFNFYADDSTDTKPVLFTQRCIALPGDSLMIDNGNVYVNNKIESNTESYFYNYHFKTKRALDSLFLVNHELNEGGAISNELDYSFSMNEKTAALLKNDSLVTHLYKNIEKSDFGDEQMYTNDTVHKWNKHNFGPLYIPKKGDILKLDTSNIYEYKRLIELENDATILVENNNIQLNGKRITEIEIKNNYYFVLGDNRDNAIDSRYWGLLSEQNILGKITRKLISNKD